jgi:multiple sugar transport system substrate-binding protein
MRYQGDRKGSLMGRRSFTRFAALASVVVLAASACGGSTPTTAPASAAASVAPSTATVQRSPSAVPSTAKPGQIINGHVVVRWFVGLGSGTNPSQITMEQQVVKDFNALQDKTPTGKNGMPIMLSLEIVQNTTATDILKTELAANNQPDIVGPVGVKGRAGFEGEWADITPLAKAAGFDFNAYDPNLLKQLSNSSGVLDGFPYAVYPSMIFFNKDLFKEAGLKYPPQKVGEQYTMPDGTKVDWTWDTVRKVAMLLSVDKNGKDATQTGFDPANQTQFGFDFMWSEGRRMGSDFGSGGFVAADGKTAQFPDPWKTAWTWYYNGIWTDHFIANTTEETSDLLAKGNPPSSGHVAMADMFQWYDCCMSASSPSKTIKNWDVAIMPSLNGTISAPMDMDVFSITKASPDAQDAFTALAYIAGRGDLSATYGGIPLVGDQLAFYHKYIDAMLAPQFPGNVVDWQVAIDMEKYAPAIHHEAPMPNYIKSMDDYSKIWSTLGTTKGLDMNTVFAQVVTALQADFSAAP